MCRNKVAVIVVKVGRGIKRSSRPSNMCRSNRSKDRRVGCKNRSIRKKIRTINLISIRSNLIKMNKIRKLIKWNSNINIGQKKGKFCRSQRHMDL